MEVVLEPEETKTLIDALRTYSSDLRMEIVDTDNPAYKRPLKHEREVIDIIVGKLKMATSVDREAQVEPTPDSTQRTDRVSLRLVAIW